MNKLLLYLAKQAFDKLLKRKYLIGVDNIVVYQLILLLAKRVNLDIEVSILQGKQADDGIVVDDKFYDVIIITEDESLVEYNCGIIITTIPGLWQKTNKIVLTVSQKELSFAIFQTLFALKTEFIKQKR